MSAKQFQFNFKAVASDWINKFYLNMLHVETKLHIVR